MNEQIWYVYQGGQQLGPFTSPQVKQMYASKMIPQDAYLFKVGWKDWRPIEETFEELGIAGAEAGGGEPSIRVMDRRAVAPRATIAGRVIVHNNGQLVIGSGVNISATGIFVETADQIFTVGERLKVSVRAEAFSGPFNAVVQVVRYSADPKQAVGYGLRFDGLDDKIASEIQTAVDRQNNARSGVQKLAR